MKRTGQLVFLVALILALVLYGLTAPVGLPWNTSTHLALAYLGEIVRLPEMPYPIWGFHVRVFYGAVALSVCMAALAAGLLGAVVNRYFGWRVAAAVVLVWIFFPGVWNRAIMGQRSICLASMVVVAAWLLNAVFLFVFRRAMALRQMVDDDFEGPEDPSTLCTKSAWRIRITRIAAWIFLGCSIFFSLVSLALHDYRLGEAATVFARGVVEAADGRIIVLNGACDDQIERLSGSRTVSFRNDDIYRKNLLARVKVDFPSETNLWVAAQVSVPAFIETAVRRFPDQFYLMDGTSTTLEAWEKRWKDFRWSLASKDPFVWVARRLFGYEGNCLANALQEKAGEKGGERQAYALYKRIYTEIDPGNFSALVNMNEMVRRGYVVDSVERRRIRELLEKFFADPLRREHMREIARAAGPVRADPALLEKLSTESRKRLAEKIAAGENLTLSPEIQSLVEWNDDMIRLMEKGDLVQAGRIARVILTNPKWHGFVPANVVMGSVAASEGDYVASAAFFQVAMGSTNQVPVAVLNDYADTLMHLGDLDEAEKLARRAVAASDEKFWVARLTLAQILEKKLDGQETVNIDEIKALLQSVQANAPTLINGRVRAMRRRLVR